MSSSESRTRRLQGGISIYVIAAISLAVHGGLAASAEFSFGGKSSHSPESREAVTFQYSCSADAHLAVLARGLSCSMPGSRVDCKEKAWEDFQFDLMVCAGLRDSESVQAEELAFLSPDELKEIKPEALMDIEPLDELELAKLLEQEIEEQASAAEKAESQPSPKGQVIEVLQPSVEMTPDNARFVSEFNTKVLKESVARGSRDAMVSEPATKELPTVEEPPEPAESSTSEPEEPDNTAAAKVKAVTQETGAGGKEKASPLLAMRATEFKPEHTAGEAEGIEGEGNDGFTPKQGDHEGSSEGQKAQEGQEAVSAGSNRAGNPLNLRPSSDMIARAIGGGSVDKLDGVESGDFTALNSKKWKFASFFNRMKRQVAQNWHPAGVFMRRDPTGKVYGSKNRETVLELYLKPNGSLDRAVILQSSGVDFLDDEAVAAFERAQPFPNPPAGLLEGGSENIRFSFGFHFQVGTRSDSWRVFRKQ